MDQLNSQKLNVRGLCYLSPENAQSIVDWQIHSTNQRCSIPIIWTKAVSVDFVSFILPVICTEISKLPLTSNLWNSKFQVLYVRRWNKEKDLNITRCQHWLVHQFQEITDFESRSFALSHTCTNHTLGPILSTNIASYPPWLPLSGLNQILSPFSTSRDCFFKATVPPDNCQKKCRLYLPMQCMQPSLSLEDTDSSW